MAMKRTKITDRLIVVGLLAWAATDVPWWWRPPGHSAPTPVVIGFILLMLTQSVPFLRWRRWPLLAAALAASVLAIRIGLGLNPFSAAAATLVGRVWPGGVGRALAAPRRQDPDCRRRRWRRGCPR